jgi:AcrR family transcriptional regulator
MIEKKQVIMDSCWYLLIRHQPKTLTVKQITQNLGITRAAFYRHFSSKNDLFLQMWQQRSDQISELVLIQDFDALAKKITLWQRDFERLQKWKRLESYLSECAPCDECNFEQAFLALSQALNQLPSHLKIKWLLLEGSGAMMQQRSQQGFSESKSDWLAAAVTIE